MHFIYTQPGLLVSVTELFQQEGRINRRQTGVTGRPHCPCRQFKMSSAEVCAWLLLQSVCTWFQWFTFIIPSSLYRPRQEKSLVQSHPRLNIKTISKNEQTATAKPHSCWALKNITVHSTQDCNSLTRSKSPIIKFFVLGSLFLWLYGQLYIFEYEILWLVHDWVFSLNNYLGSELT